MSRERIPLVRAHEVADAIARGDLEFPWARWALERPSLTVQGDRRIPRPGHKRDEQYPDCPGRMEGALVLDEREACLIQTFPPDYPLHGTKHDRFLQVGNACPPRLAAAVVAALTDRKDEMIVDLFAGPGGWSEGLKLLGLWDLGIELDAHACATRIAAGHATVHADVAKLDPTTFAARCTGLIASPPCQDFSVAGKKVGLDGLRGKLVYEVLRWAEALQPEWIACEQVPGVLAVWKLFARQLEEWGYVTWTGILNAADFGVPQIRRRAILMAKRGPFALPVETHAEEPSIGDFFDEPKQAWVTMAEALGWGFTEQPCGPRPLDGGAWARRKIREAIEAGTYIPKITLNTGCDWKPDGERADAQERDTHEPAPTITSRSGRQWKLHGGGWALHNRLFDPETEPCPTVMFGHDSANWKWVDGELERKVTVPEVAILQSFRPDYPFAGSKTKQFQQVGNAVPPFLAAAVARELV